MVEIERRFVEEAWNRGRTEVIEEHHSEDLVVHWNTAFHDRAGLQAYIRSVRRAFPDFHMAIDFVNATEDMITVGFAANGTHTRRFLGIPATGRLVHFTGMWTHRIEDGEIVEGWTSFNGQDILAQLGLTFPRALVAIPGLYLRRAIRSIRR